MEFKGILDRLRAIVASGTFDVDHPREGDPWEKDDKGRLGHPFVLIRPTHIVEFLTRCRDDEQLDFRMLVDLTATDPARASTDFWVNYHLLSLSRKHRLAVKCILPKSAPRMPSATCVYQAARWHEREAAEMFGITFEGHPDPRNILLPEDWVGYPLRKDYQFPREYHGISCE
jgi:NADH-quinone oxidoreductase subunit C